MTPTDPKALDTSGAVMIEFAPGCDEIKTWDRLDPFTQGYVEALFNGWITEPGWGDRPLEHFAFSDLASETLEVILKDCATFKDARPFDGKLFWDQRQRGQWTVQGFPPVVPYLGDDGKIYLLEARP